MRFKTLVFIIFVSLFILSGNVFAYNDSTTHPALTREVAEFYNSYFGGGISTQEISLMMRGATNEDAPPRYVNHFYDPIYDEGWKGELLKSGQASGAYAPLNYASRARLANLEGEHYSAASVLQLTKKLMGFDEILPSYKWVNSRYEQAKYERYWGDQTWDKAVNSYAAGDKEAAFVALGHILHALEDATVPEHVRNDTHVNEVGDGSPYENWAHEYAKQRNNNLDTAERLIEEKRAVPIYSIVKDYFYNTAKYTNANFFSKDTIKIDKYDLPIWVNERIITNQNGERIRIGYSRLLNSDNIPLVSITKTRSISKPIIYSIDDDAVSDLILSSYFHHLSRQAVLNGAGLLNLFFTQAEELKEKVRKGEIALEKEKIVPSKKIFSLYGEKNRFINNIKTFLANIDPSLLTAALTGSESDMQNNNGAFPARLDIAEVSREKELKQIYQAALIGQNNLGEVTPGQELSFEAKFKNIGDTLWRKNNVSLNLLGNLPLELERTSWLTDIRPTLLAEDIVATGGTGTFRFNIKTKEGVESNKEIIIAFAPVYRDGNTFQRIRGEAVGWRLVFAAPKPLAKSDPKEIELLDEVQNGGKETGAEIARIDKTPQTGKDPQETEAKTDPRVNPRDWAASQISIYVPPPLPASPADVIPPAAPVITTNSGLNYAVNNSSLALAGTKSADTENIFINGSSVGVEYPASTSWQKLLTLADGANLFSVIAKDAAGNESSADTIIITLDTQAPTAAININNCSLSVSSLAVSWSSASGDYLNFDVDYKAGSAASWTSWESAAIITAKTFSSPQDFTNYYFRVRARDSAGNTSVYAQTSCEINSRPVVISEVAWMGTQASTDDEWMELHNPTSQSINLAGWTLAADSGTPSINLSGTISAGGYFLLERTADTTVSDVSADIIYTGALNNSGGETLVLKDGTNREIDRTYTSTFSWIAGDNTAKKTMERVHSQVAGNIAYNWLTNRGATINGKDALGNNILGTPRAQNSVYQVRYSVAGTTDASRTITTNAVWAASAVPYFVPADITVASGATLTIEGGATVKLGGSSSRIFVEGNLVISGASGNPVIFTSVADDFDGKDSNNDGSSSPVASGWQYIHIKPSSTGSSFSYATIRYGGGSNSFGAVTIEGTVAPVANSIFSSNGYIGLELRNSNTAVSNSTFSGQSDTSDKGLYINGGSPTISNSIFSGNYYGIYAASGAAPMITGNTFTANAIPVYLNALYAQMSGNSMSNNGNNGARLEGTLTSSGTITRDVPYFFHDVTVASGATLSISAGVVVQVWNSDQVNIFGALVVNGSASAPVYFTSVYDDSVGGDTSNYNPIYAPAPGQWKYLNFSSTTASSLNYTIIRYGGGGYTQAVKVTNTPATFTNITIEKNNGRGIYLDNADAVTITNGVFNNHSDIGDYAGLYLYNSNATVADTIFRNNYIGIKATGDSAPTLSGITFENNTINDYPADLIP